MPDTTDHAAPSSSTPKPYRPEIRFVDIDAYGIVHNATYLVYLEQARIHWWRQVVREAWDWTQIGVLVAHHDIDYVAPVRLGDALEIACSVGEVGDKSIEVKYALTCKASLLPGRRRCSSASTTPRRSPLRYLVRGATPSRPSFLNDPNAVFPRRQLRTGLNVDRCQGAVLLQFLHA